MVVSSSALLPNQAYHQVIIKHLNPSLLSLPSSLYKQASGYMHCWYTLEENQRDRPLVSSRGFLSPIQRSYLVKHTLLHTTQLLYLFVSTSLDNSLIDFEQI